MQEIILWTEWDEDGKDINGSIEHDNPEGGTTLYVFDAPSEIELVKLAQDYLLEELSLQPSEYILRLRPISEKD